MPVTAQNIFARKNYLLERNMNKMRKLYHAREFHRRMRGANNFAGGNTYDISLAHKNKDNGFLHRADCQRFVVAVE